MFVLLAKAHTTNKYNYEPLKAHLAATFDGGATEVWLDQDELSELLESSCARAHTGRFTEEWQARGKTEKDVVATIPRHVAQMGYFCRLGKRNKQVYLQVWTRS